MIGYIYKISCKGNDACYVGSTNKFNVRQSSHKSRCNNPKSPKYNYKLYKYIRTNGGWDAWDMTVIEEYPYIDKIELHKRERHWIDTFKASLNYAIPSRTHKEYIKDWYYRNKDRVAKVEKQYRENNKEKIAVRKKKYYQDNKETIAKCQNQYYQENKERISNRNSQKVNCPCGSVVNKGNISHHNKTKKHQSFINSSYQDNRTA